MTSPAGDVRPQLALGQIWELNFPYTDKTDFKRRPTVVVAASPMGAGQDQAVWVVMVTSKVRHKADGDIFLPQSSRRYLTYDSLIRTRRVTYVPPEVFLDPERSRYMGAVEDEILVQIINQLARMFA